MYKNVMCSFVLGVTCVQGEKKKKRGEKRGRRVRAMKRSAGHSGVLRFFSASLFRSGTKVWIGYHVYAQLQCDFSCNSDCCEHSTGCTIFPLSNFT